MFAVSPSKKKQTKKLRKVENINSDLNVPKLSDVSNV